MKRQFAILFHIFLLLALLVPACARQPQPATIEVMKSHSEGKYHDNQLP
jgi:hypothetical protein